MMLFSIVILSIPLNFINSFYFFVIFIMIILRSFSRRNILEGTFAFSRFFALFAKVSCAKSFEMHDQRKFISTKFL